MSKKVKQLYEQFKPKHYEVYLAPDKDKLVFSGNVKIEGQKTHRPSKRITLHQKGLKITSAKLVHKHKDGDKDIKVRVNHHGSYDEVRLHTEHLIYPGHYIIELEFEGNITSHLNGIYPSFFEEKSEKHTLIATQFESHHAREAFPCIDEPAAKATFDLTLKTLKIEQVISNTPVKTETVKGNDKTLLFETTPIMSTYLLAFVFGNLDYKQAKTKGNVDVKVWATPENVAHTAFALDVAVQCLDFFEQYFDIKYPLAKCDLVALPDFSSGAMENWGCLTFRDRFLLVDSKNTSVTSKQFVAMVVAHEVAHQWFGNLVTMKWWTDLWLNEGFASWIEYLAVDHIFPDWNMWTQFIAEDQQQAFLADALENTHPIEVEVRHPDEISTIFDTISYSKGASVIHMLHEYLGEKPFRDGLRHYLKQHAYSNTDTIDLWVALEKVSKKPVKHFMHTWTTMPGFPIVNFKVDAHKVSISQQRYILGKNTDSTDQWPIPLLSTNTDLPELVKKKSSIQHIKTKNVMFNKNHAAFYRATYDSELLDAYSAKIIAGKLCAEDRLGLLADLFEASKAGYFQTTNALDFLENYRTEDNAAVWDVIFGVVGEIYHVFDDKETRKLIRPYIAQLASLQLKRLGWDSKKTESYFDQILRPSILSLSSLAGVKDVINEANNRFEQIRLGKNVSPDIHSVIYSTVSRNGDSKQYKQFQDLLEKTTSSEERTKLIFALCNFKQSELIEKSLETIITDKVRLQDVSYWIGYCFGNSHARKQCWDWLIKNWDWIENNLGSDTFFTRMPMYAANLINDKKDLPKYEAFFAKHDSPALKRSIKQGTETIHWKLAWKKRDLKTIQVFLKSE